MLLIVPTRGACVYLERLSQQLGRVAVAAVEEEARGVPDRDRLQRPPHRPNQSLAGPGLRPAQRGLKLREGLLDGVELRRGVGWQVQQSSQPRPSMSSRTFRPFLCKERLSITTPCPRRRLGTSASCTYASKTASFLVVGPSTATRGGPIPSCIMLARAA